ncbi:hypothetical protein EHS86_14320 [Erwinia amylovora]|nr:hypothetical protein AD997_10140 [Erwinia amylovora]RWS37396.1 hypothetical protein EHS86_14320 [Erwinia amylovora]CCO78911.1 hypothetical protein BN432_2116 [Erwinia amylovora Ea356]CCO82709.1 hypothetical protein BN433_2141 [Erwinia amylovora Ea266]CCO99388.1 hypothetical protein BN438_2108 [Erwinia amylovora UPN527]
MPLLMQPSPHRLSARRSSPARVLYKENRSAGLLCITVILIEKKPAEAGCNIQVKLLKFIP